MPPKPSVKIVSDPDDDRFLFRSADRRSDPATGVAVARPVPGVRDVRQLANDVLVAFGKHYDALTRERQLRNDWQLAELWAKAERIRHLVVWDADRLPPVLWQRLAELAATGHHHLWLVVHASPGAAQLAAVQGARPRRPSDLYATLGAAGPPAVGDYGERWLLPRDSFFTFRAACRRGMNPRRFAEVDAAYLEAHDQTSRWLRARSSRHPRHPHQVIDQLRDLTVNCDTPDQALVRLRAAQAAYFQDGLLVQLIEVSTPAPFDLPTTGVTRRVTARLRRLVTPAWPCALTAVSAGVSVKALAELNIGDVAPDGAQVTVDGRIVEIPDHAAALIRAQLLARRHSGAGSKNPLLVTATGARHQPGQLRLRLDTARQQAALVPPSERRTPLWQLPSPAGLNVTFVALAPKWQPAP